MVGPMDGFQTAEGHVRVDLGRGNIGVPQESLDGSEIGSVLHHMGGAAVA
jgi:hypothetical protein